MNHVIHLPEYGFLGIAGKDAIKFFQGYTTCELNNLDSQQSGIGATCNLKGRMLASYRLVSNANGLLLIRMDRRLVEPMIEFLKKYIVFSKATLENLSDQYMCYGQIRNTTNSQRSEEGLVSCPAGKDQWIETDKGSVVCINPGAEQDTPNEPERCELWLDSKRLSEASPTETTSDAELWHHAEIEQGLAWVTAETSEEYIPQMFNYDKINAINFEKGCYLGQEIVARMQYRGAVKKKLHRASITGKHLIGENILDSNGRAVGTIVSNSNTLILAVIQTQSKTKDQSLDDDLPKDVELKLANGDNISLSAVG
ncbi:MAG: folate-binding protein YgfZ [Candidatus Azotimanducaceae bacterium]|jgi:folate-binding protein YgfZ